MAKEAPITNWDPTTSPSRVSARQAHISEFRFYQQQNGDCWVAINGNLEHPAKFSDDLKALAFVLGYMAEERRAMRA